jgi:lysophospholipase L1-like esterase
MMRKRLAAIALCASMAACSSPLVPRVPLLKATRFVAFGDSLTEGVTVSSPPSLLGLSAGLPVSYPFQLDDRLRSRYPDQNPVVFNAGRAGELATDALPRLRTVLNEADADVLLLLHGANDLNGGIGRMPATLDAIRGMIREARGRDMSVMLATLPPQCSGGTPPRGGATPFLASFNQMLSSMGVQEGAKIVDLFTKVNISLIGVDCLHPQPGGYVRMADVFFDDVIAAFERRRTAAIAPR